MLLLKTVQLSPVMKIPAFLLEENFIIPLISTLFMYDYNLFSLISLSVVAIVA